MFDILILSAEKDFNKIKFLYDSIEKNIDGFNKIHCISNIETPKNLKVPEIEYYTDNDILNFDFLKFQGEVLKRKGWYIQQYMKLFQDITLPDYLVVDSDVFFNKKINIIDNNKPSFFFGRNQHHLPYFDFSKRILNLDKIHNFSFINEIMYMKRDIINKMLSQINVDKYEFFDLSVKILNDMNEPAGMSEYELYGNFVTKHFPNLYNYKQINSYLGGKHDLWNDVEISNYIKNFKNTNYDIVSMHTWI